MPLGNQTLDFGGVGQQRRRLALESWEREGRLAFVDASPDPLIETIECGSFDLGALLARVENAMRRIGAQRVAVDSLGAVFSQGDADDAWQGEERRRPI